MQDIDFDEIDRAVSSATNPGRRAVNTVAVPAAPAEIATPTPAPEPPVESVDNVGSPVASSPAVRRSSGRFMDVVHPSSDMRTSRADAPTVAARSESARPSAPSAPSLHREDAVTPQDTTERPELATAASSAFHWPDPIDMNGTVEDVIDDVPAPAPVAVEPEVVIPEIEPVAAPLESPFLADAKVEKRPLGAFSDPDSELPLLDDFPDFSAHTPADVTKAEVTDEELSFEDTEVAEESEVQPTPVDEEADVAEEVGEVELPETTTSLEVNEPTPVVEEAPVGPTSITQQYKEQPSKDAQASGSIFDTDAYHKPVTPPVRKRSTLLLAAGIVGLVIVGAGAGALIYFKLLPLLG